MVDPLKLTEADDETNRRLTRWRQELIMAACVPEEYWTILHDLKHTESTHRVVFLSSAPSRNWVYDRFVKENNRG